MNYDSSISDYDVILGGLFLIAILIGLVLAIISYVVTALIYFRASKTNGFSDVAYIAWIPLLNVYSLFLLTANRGDNTTDRAIAKRNTLIYFGLIVISFIPFIGFIASLGATCFGLYYTYHLLYRWSGETGKAVLYIILTIISCGLFFMIYGLMRMNRPFKA